MGIGGARLNPLNRIHATGTRLSLLGPLSGEQGSILLVGIRGGLFGEQGSILCSRPGFGGLESSTFLGMKVWKKPETEFSDSRGNPGLSTVLGLNTAYCLLP